MAGSRPWTSARSWQTPRTRSTGCAPRCVGETLNESSPDPVSRIDALEMRIAEQDRTIADLNEVITSQWAKIDALARQLAQLRDELQTMQPGRDAPEPPPPHY